MNSGILNKVLVYMGWKWEYGEIPPFICKVKAERSLHKCSRILEKIVQMRKRCEIYKGKVKHAKFYFLAFYRVLFFKLTFRVI